MQMKVDGIDEFLADITKVFDDAELIYRRCAYEGAKVLADEVKKGIEGLKVDNGWGTQEHPLNGVNGYVKADIRDGMGISKIETEGGLTKVSVGFSGYSSRVTSTKRWTTGTPIQMLARSVESGTSFMRKQPFVRPAINRAKKKIDEAIEKEAVNLIKERMK